MVIIQDETTKDPISLIGREAGVCWGGNITDPEKNFKRGLDCIKSNHGRTMEYPQIYVVLDEYSARVIRELYTHIAGGPTRLQSSTRYIKYGDFSYITPPNIKAKPELNSIYEDVMKKISDAYKELESMDCPKEDIANILPLGMTTKIVLRTNLRNLVDMSHQRLCSRAYWEFRKLMTDVINALKDYSDEWNYLITDVNLFKPKCEITGFCTESKGCGRMPKNKDFS